MLYIKVQFQGDFNVQAYQVIDDTMTCIGYINIDGTELTVPEKTESFVIDSAMLTEDDIRPGYTWHDPTCTIRIRMTHVQNLNMLQLYPELGVYIKSNGIESHVDNTYTYVYVNSILDEHRAILLAFGATILPK